MSKRTMQEVVAEFNKLSGQNIKRFSTVAVGEKRIELFKKGLFKETGEVTKPKTSHPVEKASAVGASRQTKNVGAKPVKKIKTCIDKAKRTWKMASMTVDGHPYRSIKSAFDTLGLPLNKHGKFRLELKASGKETFEHDGKKYLFVLVAQQQLP